MPWSELQVDCWISEYAYDVNASGGPPDFASLLVPDGKGGDRRSSGERAAGCLLLLSIRAGQHSLESSYAFPFVCALTAAEQVRLSKLKLGLQLRPSKIVWPRDREGCSEISYATSSTHNIPRASLKSRLENERARTCRPALAPLLPSRTCRHLDVRLQELWR